MKHETHQFVRADNEYVQGGHVCTRCKVIVSDAVHQEIMQTTPHFAPDCNEVSTAEVLRRILAPRQAGLVPI